ncbi:MAG TPA: hypothetical protein VGL46_18595 [Pseudonocardiaceae bacterium]|jgi:hypothetical protein
MPYTDASVATIDSLTREVEYLRQVVEGFWTRDHAAGERRDRAAGQIRDQGSLPAAG